MRGGGQDRSTEGGRGRTGIRRGRGAGQKHFPKGQAAGCGDVIVVEELRPLAPLPVHQRGGVPEHNELKKLRLPVRFGILFVRTENEKGKLS